MAGKVSVACSVAAMLVFHSASVFALPSGGQVNAGQASIASSGNQTTIDQSSQRAAIDWSSFNVGANERVQFVDPNASAITLNRIHDSGSSAIDGQLLSNGNVWLINPNGVVFGKNAQVNVGGLLATTSDIANKDFMAGNYNFTPGGNPNASVINNGSITVAQSGLAVLVAPNVVNNGTIQAKLGTVALGSGDMYTLDFYGDGLINLQASSAINTQLVANHGTIKADGGTVTLTTAAASSEVSSLINMDGLIEADTVSGKTGTVRIRSAGKTNFSGTINARGGADGGDGGYAEVSGQLLSFTGFVDLSAPKGKAGTLLLDPQDLFITANGNAPEAGASGISASEVQSLLANQDVTLSSTGAGSQAGDITVAAPITWASDHILGLDAYHSLVIAAPITITNLGGMILTYNDGGIGGTLSFPGGNVTFNNLLSSLIINGNLYTLVNNIQTLATDIVSNPNGFYALANNYDASADGTYLNAPIAFFGFTGTFEGLGNTISNLKIDGLSAFPSIGLFANIATGGLVENIGLTNVNITGVDEVGGLAGQNSGTIGQSYVTGLVTTTGTSTAIAGGLVGTNSGTIERSYSSATVTGSQETGGLVGLNEGAISDSYTNGTVNGTNNYSGVNLLNDTGGLVGFNIGGSITRSYSSATVNGTEGQTGGLVGNINGNTSITNSFASGTVNDVLGGTGIDLDFNAGGLAGGNSGTITGSYSTAAVNGGGVAGGLVGENAGTVNQSYETGPVQGLPGNSGGLNAVGGLAGINLGLIENSNAVGNVSGVANIGLLVGLQNGPGTLTNDGTTISNATPAGQLPPDFSPQVWGIAAGQNNDEPYLLWQFPLPFSQGSQSGSNTPSSPMSSPQGQINPANPSAEQEGQSIYQETQQLSSQQTNMPLVGNQPPAPPDVSTLAPAAGGNSTASSDSLSPASWNQIDLWTSLGYDYLFGWVDPIPQICGNNACAEYSSAINQLALTLTIEQINELGDAVYFGLTPSDPYVASLFDSTMIQALIAGGAYASTAASNSDGATVQADAPSTPPTSNASNASSSNSQGTTGSSDSDGSATTTADASSSDSGSANNTNGSTDTAPVTDASGAGGSGTADASGGNGGATTTADASGNDSRSANSTSGSTNTAPATDASDAGGSGTADASGATGGTTTTADASGGGTTIFNNGSFTPPYNAVDTGNTTPDAPLTTAASSASGGQVNINLPDPVPIGSNNGALSPSIDQSSASPSVAPATNASGSPATAASTDNTDINNKLNLAVSSGQIGYNAASTINDPAGTAEDLATNVIGTMVAGQQNAQAAQQGAQFGQTVGVNEYLPRDSNGNPSISVMGSRVVNSSQCGGDLACLENNTNQLESYGRERVPGSDTQSR